MTYVLGLTSGEVGMNCDLKSNIKLAGNIIKKKDADERIGYYIPFALKGPEYRSWAMDKYLSKKQKYERDRELFQIDAIQDSDERFCELEENQSMCEGCKYRDICV